MGRLYKRSKVWYIDYSVFGKRQRERIGANKKLAENVLKKKELEIVENRYLDIKKEEKIKFPDFAKEYLEYYSKPNKKSWHSDVDTINILNRFFSSLYLYEITPLLVEKFKTERIKDVSPATVNRNLACLKCLFNRAIEWGKTQNNPVRKIKLFRENNRRLRYLELDEIDNLLNNSSSYLKPIIILALNTGMRKGEILELKWPDLDFKQNLIYLLNTKSGEKREIPMNEQVRTALIKVRKHPQSPFVFCKEDGTSYGDIKKSFYTAMKKSGIMNFRFHDLRHTFASHLVMSGVDLNTVRELMGHKTIEMTLRYAHLSPDCKRRAVKVLDEKYGPRWQKVGTNLAQSRNFENKQNFIFSEPLENKALVK